MMQFKFVLNTLYNEHKFAFSCIWFLLLAHADFRMPSWHRRKYIIIEVKKKQTHTHTHAHTHKKPSVWLLENLFILFWCISSLGYLYYESVSRRKWITYMNAPSMLPGTWQALSKHYRYYAGVSSKNKWTLVFLYPGRPAGNICCSWYRCSPAIFLIFFKHLTFFSSQLL